MTMERKRKTTARVYKFEVATHGAGGSTGQLSLSNNDNETPSRLEREVAEQLNKTPQTVLEHDLFREIAIEGGHLYNFLSGLVCIVSFVLFCVSR